MKEVWIKGSDKRLQFALKDWAEMNTSTQWARLSCKGGLIKLEYGVIHSNGMEEAELGTIFYMTHKDGKLSTMRTHHCG